jgi:hypothetical protein
MLTKELLIIASADTPMDAIQVPKVIQLVVPKSSATYETTCPGLEAEKVFTVFAAIKHAAEQVEQGITQLIITTLPAFNSLNKW